MVMMPQVYLGSLFRPISASCLISSANWREKTMCGLYLASPAAVLGRGSQFSAQIPLPRKSGRDELYARVYGRRTGVYCIKTYQIELEHHSHQGKRGFPNRAVFSTAVGAGQLCSFNQQIQTWVVYLYAHSRSTDILNAIGASNKIMGSRRQGQVAQN